MMKVLIINAVYKIMSTGRTYSELHDYLCSLGHECKIIYGQNKEDYEDTIYLGNYFDHKLHALLSRSTGKVGCYSSNSTKKLLKFLDEYKPDIVHLGNLHSNFINIEMLLKYLGEKNIKTTLTLHDCFFYTGGCVHYTLNNCFKWQEKCCECKFYKKQGSWFFDKTNYLFNMKENYFKNIKKLGVIGVSDWISEEAKKSVILKNAKIIKRIYNWVDLDLFKPTKINKENIEEKLKNKFIILGVASGWSVKKGLDKFIQLSKIISSDFVIILIGNVEAETNLPNNIINISATNDVDELVKYYNLADVFLQLSKEETFGKVVAESLACGTPAIVYDSTASPELVKDGCGYSIKVDEEVDLIFEKIKEVKVLGKNYFTDNCRQKALREFNKNINCFKIVELWNELKNYD